jgi:hypothetical protein
MSPLLLFVVYSFIIASELGAAQEEWELME